ncbi:hypothetical protein OX284_006900 [Flavobacterium sp. SUN046]|uniref:hypothetical protein n=1 Tax=Flavobacterium sp. SUN046 TaxID=3002440 RepID=UPI002DB5DB33|nr:hypothetical protein [Flavobacterium sp. SUN046]MEC4049152.1 hypothetical protein [Flavobacterium sp. SUN046]
MPNSKPFPSKEADLNTYFQLAIAYLILNSTRLLITANNQADLTALLTTWNIVFPESQNKNTRTKSIVENKDATRENIINLLRTVYADIPASVLTIEDRNTLNITKKDATRTPSPVPTSKPICQVDTSRRLEHTISHTDEDGSQGKPAGVRGCQIWFKIGAPAIDPVELTYLTTDTASPYTHRFAGEFAGKNVYYWLRWENTRGEVGPWSDVVIATVTA